MSNTLLVILALVLAIVLDLAFVFFRRRRNSRKNPSKKDARERAAILAQKAGAASSMARTAGKPEVSLPASRSVKTPVRKSPLAEKRPVSASNPTGSASPKQGAPKPADGSTTHVQVSVDLHPGESVRITIDSLNGKNQTVVARSYQPEAFPGQTARSAFSLPAWPTWFSNWPSRMRHWASTLNAAGVLLAIALAVYLLSHVIGLIDWPIYFFTDEAIQTNQAADFIHNDFKGREGDLLPTYFANGGQYNLSESVYAQVLPYLLFGKSEFVTRFVSVLITLAGALALSLFLRDAFKLPIYWAGVLLLGITPAWFLHSRTAFEVVEAVSFYAIFLFFYFRYRLRDSRYLFPALAAGGLCFYAYSAAQLVIVVTGLFLLFSDLPYHWRNRKTALGGAVLIAVMVIPYLRFLYMHPEENYRHLVILQSYWTQSGSIFKKLGTYFTEYFKGLNPVFWYIPSNSGLVRHIMKGYGNILLITAPFALLGLFLCLRKFRETQYRAMTFALLAAPSGGALAETSVLRALFVVVPVAAFTAIGLSAAIDFLARRWPRRLLEAALAAALIAASFYMLGDALRKGPTWYTDYSLYGMQYGGRQLTDAMLAYEKKNPSTHFIVSPSWANGTDEIMNFFLPEGFPYEMNSVDSFIAAVLPLNADDVLVMTPEEYLRAKASTLFESFRVQQTLNWPDGRPGFYFVQMAYTPDAAAQIASATAELAKPITETFVLNGETVTVTHSRFDMGDLTAGFDGNPNSLMRGLYSNPLILDMTFPAAHTFVSVKALMGAAPTRLTVTVYPEDGGPAQTYSAEIARATENHEVVINLPAPVTATHLHLEFLVTDEEEPTHVHVYEVTLTGEDGWVSRASYPAS